MSYLVELFGWVEENDLFAMGCDGFGVVFNPLASKATPELRKKGLGWKQNVSGSFKGGDNGTGGAGRGLGWLEARIVKFLTLYVLDYSSLFYQQNIINKAANTKTWLIFTWWIFLQV